MKTRSYFFILIVLAFASPAFGQDVLITPKRVIYKRANPLSEDKAQITVDHPKVSGPARGISRKIERAISFARLMNLNVEQQSQWLEAAGFDVDHNRNGVLSVTLWMSGTGHFSSTMYRRVVVDTKKGEPATAESVFTDLRGLAALVRTYQIKEIEQAKKDIPKMEGYGDFDGARWFDVSSITAEDLQEFSVGPDGVTFTYDYGFPRIMVPAQPGGVFLITWRELKPFIRRGGLLGKLVY
jgi:hypothetical protein